MAQYLFSPTLKTAAKPVAATGGVLPTPDPYQGGNPYLMPGPGIGYAGGGGNASPPNYTPQVPATTPAAATPAVTSHPVAATPTYAAAAPAVTTPAPGATTASASVPSNVSNYFVPKGSGTDITDEEKKKTDTGFDQTPRNQTGGGFGSRGAPVRFF